MATSKLTAQTITDSQIRALRGEAREAGDDVQVHVCSVALGEQDPVTTGEQWEERYGGGGLDRDRKAIMAVRSQEQAVAMCVEAINDARAQE